MTSIPVARSRPGPAFQAIGVTTVAVGAAVAWYAWMGWDHEYQTNAAGELSGPYEAWQVGGCALTLLTLYVGALLLGVRPVPAAVALTVAFTAAWTEQASATDETGLYGVGMVMLLVGLTVATTVVGAVTLGLRKRFRR
jgi:hypothetical protein